MPPRKFNPKTCAGNKANLNGTWLAGERVTSAERERREHRGLCGACGRPRKLVGVDGSVATYTCTTCGTTKTAKRGSPMFKAAREGILTREPSTA